ncbi:MAG: calcium-binding protein [Pseudomonadota bacterium]
MITIDATNTIGGFVMGDTALGNFASYVSHDATSYTWLDINGSTITVIGSGITVDSNNIPTGGTITGMNFTLFSNSSGNTDIVATGLNFALTDLNFDVNSARGAEVFWQTILDGNIGTYLGPVDDMSGFFSILAGDFGKIREGNFEFADDDVFTGASGLSVFCGDGQEVIGAQARGGNDTIQGVFAFGVGDVQFVKTTGLLIAGDDTIRLTGASTGTQLGAYGDAVNITGDAFVQGGADVIDLSASTNLTALIVGDVSSAADRAVVTAGEDTITGTQQGDIIVGDVDFMQNDAALFAANDTIYGIGGDDTIYGDVRTLLNDATVEADGNDFINGGSGNDSIFGNGGNDTLIGGADNDTILGGSGDDAMRGDDGRDSLQGGDGRDTLNGGLGNDSLEGGDGNDTMNGADGRDRILGGDGLDSLVGGAGGDNIVGGVGRDTINGGTGDDRMAGNQGADIFVFNGAFGNDTIRDFNINRDEEKIDLSAVAAITDFTDLMDNHVDDSSGLVVISDGLGNSITLERITDMNLLEAGDFLF